MVVADYNAHRAERKLTWVHWAAQQFKSDFEVPYRIRQVFDGIGTGMTLPSCDICNETMIAIDRKNVSSHPSFLDRSELHLAMHYVI